MKRVAIVQSNYIPWKGYFDLINSADEFILLDDVQYTKNDWRNRNRVKTQEGAQWLTIPVLTKGKYKSKIRDIQIADERWRIKHWRSITQNYAKATHFETYRERFESLYFETHEKFLSDINYLFLKTICDILGIDTRISRSTDFKVREGKTERLVSLCKQCGAREYISGPAAKAYIDLTQFEAVGIHVAFFNYEGYPAYNQLFCPPFIHEVSIIDLIFNEGAERAKRFMLSFGMGHKTKA